MMTMFTLLLSPLFQAFASTTTAQTCAKPTFLGLVPWYQYLTLAPDATTGTCEVTSFNNSQAVLGAQSPFLLIAFAILDDLIRVAALVAVGFVIYGGIQYVTSQGSPEDTTKARQTIIYALIGLVIAILAASIVAFIGGKLAGTAVTKG